MDKGNANVNWNNNVLKATGATGDGVGAGARNTTLIIASQMPDNPSCAGLANGEEFAAKIAADCKVGGFGDWYLPSKYELNLLLEQKGLAGTNDAIWSSTETKNGKGFYVDFSNNQTISYQKNGTSNVRTIRQF